MLTNYLLDITSISCYSDLCLPLDLHLRTPFLFSVASANSVLRKTFNPAVASPLVAHNPAVHLPHSFHCFPKNTQT